VNLDRNKNIVFGFDSYLENLDRKNFVFFGKEKYTELNNYKTAKSLIIKNLEPFRKKITNLTDGHKNLESIYYKYLEGGIADDSVYDLFLLCKARYNKTDAFSSFYIDYSYAGYYGLGKQDHTYIESMKVNFKADFNKNNFYIYDDKKSVFISAITDRNIDEYARELSIKYKDKNPHAFMIINPSSKRIYVRRPYGSKFDCGAFCKECLNGRGNEYAGSGESTSYFEKITDKSKKL
jgi:hypothetical protein